MPFFLWLSLQADQTVAELGQKCESGEKKSWESKWSLFASLTVSSGFSEGPQKLAISIQQEGGKEVTKKRSERDPLLPAGGDEE